MIFKTILSLCAISLLCACSSQTDNESIQKIRLQPKPDLSGMSLQLSCNKATHEVSVLVASPHVLKNEFRFTGDKDEIYVYASVADDLSGFSKEDSKRIFNIINNSDTLKVKTSFTNNAEFDLTKQKSVIQSKLKACI